MQTRRRLLPAERKIVFRDHPDVQELSKFISGSKPLAESNTELVRHLLARCPECTRQLLAMGWNPSRLDRLVHLETSGREQEETQRPGVGPYNYDQAFSRAERTLDIFLERGRPVEQPPGALLAELFPLFFPDSEAKPTDTWYAIPQFVRWLIERSYAVRYQDTEEMLHLARLARHAADSCSPEVAGSPQKLADLRVRAFGQLGNALRVSGRLHESEEALAVAWSLLSQGTGDAAVHAGLLNQTASLRIFQRRFEEAVTALQKAEEIYRDLRDRREVASTLLQRSIAHLYAGELEVTVRILQRAMAWIDEEEDPHLLLAARHNLVRCYIDMGRHEEAKALYFEVRELNKRFQDPLIQLRIAWQEGQLLRGLGHLREAEEKLLGARRGFLQRGLAYEVATVSLDLAEVYAKLGRVDEVNQLVGETVPIFRALRIGRELLATLIQLRQTVHQERQAADQDLS